MTTPRKSPQRGPGRPRLAKGQRTYRVAFRIPEGHAAKLATIAKRGGITVSILVRKILTSQLSRETTNK